MRCFNCRNLLAQFRQFVAGREHAACAGFVCFLGRYRIVELQNIPRRYRARANFFAQPDIS